jgi:uncharacterized protein YijF (DUF1287 family)
MRSILTGYVINLNRRKRKYPGAEVARFLGVTTSAVIRAAYSEELPELQKYL